jgi:hypothetical protein
MLRVPDYVALLLQAGAEMRPGGPIKFLETDTNEPSRHPANIAFFVLRGKAERMKTRLTFKLTTDGRWERKSGPPKVLVSPDKQRCKQTSSFIHAKRRWAPDVVSLAVCRYRPSGKQRQLLH